MAISRSFDKKAPSQRPVDYFNCVPFGGARGLKHEPVPDQNKSGPLREKIFGRKDLSKK